MFLNYITKEQIEILLNSIDENEIHFKDISKKLKEIMESCLFIIIIKFFF